MNIVLRFVLLFLMLLSGVSQVVASNTTSQHIYSNALKLTEQEAEFIVQHPKIRVHNELNWAPFNYHEEGREKGFSIDYMNLLAKKIGIEVEYISGPSWGQFLDLLKTKQLDVMLNIINTPDRREYILFTQSYLEPFTAIFSRDDYQQAASLKDLHGETVALPEGFYTEELIKRYYPQINLLLTKDLKDALDAVAQKKATAAIGEFCVINYLLKKHQISGIKAASTIEDPRFSNKLNLGIRNDWPLLQSILQKAIEKVSDEELLYLRDKWFGSGEKKIDLTQYEQEFIKNYPILKVHNETYWPPFNYNENGLPKGLSIDYMNMLASKLGMDVEYISGPSWSQFLQMVQQKRLDVMLNIVPTKSRKDFLLFTHDYINSSSGIFAKEGDNFTSLEDLNGKTLAVTKGFFYQEILEANYPEIKLLKTKNISQAIEAVVLENADALLEDFNVASYVLQQKTITSIRATAELKDTRFSSRLTLGVRNDLPVLRDILKKAMSQISPEEMTLLKRKWLKKELQGTNDKLGLSFWEKTYLEQKHTVRMCNNPDWSPIEYIDNQTHAPAGIAIDTVKLLESRIGHNIKIEPIATQSWIESQNQLKQRRCDILPAVIYTEKKAKYASFTKPYMDYKVVIITRDDSPFINSIEEIKDKGIARKSGSGLIPALREQYKHIRIIETQSTEQAFKKVSSGEIFATLAVLPVASYNISKFGLTNLKIAGYSDIDMHLSMAVRNDEPMLLSILEKGLAGISEQEHRDIFNKWVSIKIDRMVDYTLYVKTLGLVALFGCFMLYRHMQLSRYNKILKELAITDKLTQINNRAAVETEITNQVHLNQRYKEEFSVLLLDIDNFKSVNDTWGHQVGDQLLIDFAEVLTQQARTSDKVGRWGGEEFMIVCPKTQLSGAAQLAEKLRISIAGHQFDTANHKTASIGYAQYKQGETAFELIKRVDQALYQAKTRGRNRAVGELTTQTKLNLA